MNDAKLKNPSAMLAGIMMIAGAVLNYFLGRLSGRETMLFDMLNEYDIAHDALGYFANLIEFAGFFLLVAIGITLILRNRSASATLLIIYAASELLVLALTFIRRTSENESFLYLIIWMLVFTGLLLCGIYLLKGGEGIAKAAMIIGAVGSVILLLGYIRRMIHYAGETDAAASIAGDFFMALYLVTVVLGIRFAIQSRE